MNREYHENENGGIFCVRVPKETSEKVWTNFVLSAIGEQFSQLLE